MANIDKQDFIWNGKLAGATNLLYTDLINVDVVKPPYSWWPRNSSYFLETRLWYIAEKALQEFMDDHLSSWWIDYVVDDVEVVWDSTCSRENWLIWFLITKKDSAKNISTVIWMDIKDWCVDTDSVRFLMEDEEWWHTFENDNKCRNKRLMRTKWLVDRVPYKDYFVWFEGIEENSLDWIQLNKLEGWVYRWYFTTERLLAQDETVKWSSWLVWSYVTIYDSYYQYYPWSGGRELWDNSWYPWQTRMIIWVSTDWKYLVLDNAWDWFAVADANWETYTQQKWEDCIFWIYKEEKETLYASIWENILWYDWTIEYRWYTPTDWNIISMVDCNGRVFALYDNWWVRYSTVWWRDSFFFNDEIYVWEDKTSLCSFKDTVIAFWPRKITTIVPVEYEKDAYVTYFRAYEQAATVWVWSPFAYWEHDWFLIFVSNDKRLMNISVAQVSWKYMLEFTDIWQEIINAKLALMLDSDEAFVADYNNELRVIVQSKPNPEKDDSLNSQTHIYKFDSRFKIYTEDHLEHILLQWCKYWVWYWDSWVYIRWLVKLDGEWHYEVTDDWREWIAMDFKINPELYNIYDVDKYKNTVVANCAAFLIENETTNLTQSSNWTSTWAPDLFRMAKLNRLIVTLWYWRYSDQTQIRITSYREGIGEVTKIKLPEQNDWMDLVSLAQTGESLDDPKYKDLKKSKECLLSTLGEDQTKYVHYEREDSDLDYELKITDLVPERPRCESRRRTWYHNHNISIDDTIYELAPHKPLVIWWIWDTQHYSSQIKLEIISESWDIMNFWGFLAELYVAPSFYEWADWENLIEMGSC